MKPLFPVITLTISGLLLSGCLSVSETPSETSSEVPIASENAPAIDHCGTAGVDEPGTTFYSDGSTGSSEECFEQMMRENDERSQQQGFMAPAPEAEVEEAPAPAVEPAPAPAPAQEENLHFSSCADAQAAGYSHMRRGEPGYRPGLDRDGDGIACDKTS